MSVDYSTITDSVNRLDGLVADALHNDLRENVLVQTRLESLSQTLMAPLILAQITNDAIGQYLRLRGTMSRIRDCHDWLAASKDSPELLRRAKGEWERMRDQQDSVTETVSRYESKYGDSIWDGRAHTGHIAWASDKERREVEFAGGLRDILRAVDRAIEATDELLIDAKGKCEVAVMQCGIPATTAPNRYSSRARNWRLRAVAGHLETLETHYGRLRAGLRWHQASQDIYELLRKNSDTLQKLQNAGGGGGAQQLLA